MIQFIIQTAGLLAILYFMPWLGELKNEARLVGASVGAVFFSAFLMLIWELFKAPYTMQAAALQNLRQLETVLHLNEDKDRVVKLGSEIYDRWYQAMPAATLDADYSEASQIEKEALAFVEKYYDIRDVLYYQHGHDTRGVQEPFNIRAFLNGRLERFVHTISVSSTKAELRASELGPMVVGKRIASS